MPRKSLSSEQCGTWASCFIVQFNKVANHVTQCCLNLEVLQHKIIKYSLQQAFPSQYMKQCLYRLLILQVYMQHIYTVLIRLPADVEVLMNPGRWKYNKVEFSPSGGSRFYSMGFAFFKSLQCLIKPLQVLTLSFLRETTLINTFFPMVRRRLYGRHKYPDIKDSSHKVPCNFFFRVLLQTLNCQSGPCFSKDG